MIQLAEDVPTRTRYRVLKSFYRLCLAGTASVIFLSYCSSKWFCLLDVASYVPTSELNLGQHRADFVVLSFYKMFGYPTGLGALLVRKSSSYVLQKRYFGGGTVLMALSDEMFHKKRENITEA